jgi:hypothetical protein
MDLSALESAAKALELRLDSLTFWLWVSTATVAVGLLIEYLPEFAELIKTRPFDRKKLRTLIGGLLITVGVVGELVVAVKSSGVEAKLRTTTHNVESLLNGKAADARKEANAASERASDLEDEAAMLEDDAAALDEEAATANGRAKEAEKDAARSLKAAEKERLERVGLEAQIAPRRLTPEQQVAIGNACRIFSRHLFSRRSVEIKIVTYALDLEAEVLAEQIRQALLFAELTVDFRPTSFMPLGSFMKGIQVSGPISQYDVVLGISASLSRDGKLAVAKPEFTAPDTAVSILIGVKPIS